MVKIAKGSKFSRVMFLGEYRHAIDDKGRLMVPAKFRGALGKGAVVTIGLDRCLSVYPRGEWKKVADKLANLPIAQENTRAFQRHMLSGATEVAFDGQGRALIPEYLRQYAGLSKTVVVAGLYNRLEMWDEERWDAYKAVAAKNEKEIAENMAALGV